MKYIVHGKEISQEEFLRGADGIKNIIADRKTPGGHETYWGTGHESLSSGVMPHQASEHAAWCRDKGLVGVEIRRDGAAEFNSPGSKTKYLNARGLVDVTSERSGQYRKVGGEFVEQGGKR